MPRPLHFGYPRARFAGPPRPRRALASGQCPRTRFRHPARIFRSLRSRPEMSRDQKLAFTELGLDAVPTCENLVGKQDSSEAAPCVTPC